MVVWAFLKRALAGDARYAGVVARENEQVHINLDRAYEHSSCAKKMRPLLLEFLKTIFQRLEARRALVRDAEDAASRIFDPGDHLG